MRSIFNQYLNLGGIYSTLKCFFIPKLFKPSLKLDSVLDIQTKDLRILGIELVIFDKDNTLTEPNKITICPKILIKLKQLQTDFGDKNIAIISNTAGSPNDTYYQVHLNYTGSS